MRLKKLLAVFLLVIGIVVLGMFVAVKILLSPERVRQTLVPLLEEQLHRPLSIESVEVSLFTGIQLRGLEIQEKDSDQVFISAEAIVFQYRFWPLFSGEFIIEEASLVSPQIRLQRRPDGQFNFSDLIPAASGSQEQTSAAESIESAGPVVLPLRLQVNSVTIKNGGVHFLDQTIDEAAPLFLKLSDFNLLLNNVSLEHPFDVRSSGNITGSIFRIEGQVDPVQQAVKLDLSLSALNLVPFLPYAEGQIPGELGSLQLSLDMNLAASASRIQSSGMIELGSINFIPGAAPEYEIKDSVLKVDHSIVYSPDAAQLVLDRLDLDWNGLSLHSKGKVLISDPVRIESLQLDIPATGLATLVRALPEQLASQGRSLRPDGMLGLSASLEGRADKPVELLQELKLKLDGVSVAHQGMNPRLSGIVELKKTHLSTESLLLQLEKNEAEIQLDVADVLAMPLRVQSKIRSERLELDALMASFAAPVVAVGKEPSAPTPQAKPQEAPALDLPLHLTGDLLVGQTRYQGLQADDLLVEYRLADNILTVKEVSARIAEGRFRSGMTLDLTKTGYGYKGELELSSMKTAPLVGALYPKASGTLLGTVDLKSVFQGAGTLPESIKKNLESDVHLVLSDFKLTGDGLSSKFAAFLKLPDLKVMSFSRGTLDVTLDNTVAELAGDFSGSDVRFKPRGTLSLKGPLDISLPTQLAPDLTRRIAGSNDLAQLLVGRDGWGLLPLKLRGTLDKPVFALDTAAVKTQVKEKAKEELRETIEKKVLDRLVPRQGQDPAKQTPEQKLLKGVMDNLFGK